jgi:hypothetical protein
LSYGKASLLMQRIPIAQFGVVAALPESTGGRKSAVTAELYGATGALKTVTISSDAAVDKSLISDAETAAGTTIDALAADKEAKAASAVELAELEKKRKILEEKLKIQELEKQLTVKQ